MRISDTLVQMSRNPHRRRRLDRVRRLAVALFTFLLSVSSQAAQPPPDAEAGAASLDERLDTLSEKLRATRSPQASEARGFMRIGQWVNWPNWNNWPNWPNWRNYWPNWPNY